MWLERILSAYGGGGTAVSPARRTRGTGPFAAKTPLMFPLGSGRLRWPGRSPASDSCGDERECCEHEDDPALMQLYGVHRGGRGRSAGIVGHPVDLGFHPG